MDNSSVSSNSSIQQRSTSTFAEADFRLPELEIHGDGDFQSELENQRLLQRLNSLKLEIYKEKKTFEDLDQLSKKPNSIFNLRKGVIDREVDLKGRRGVHEAFAEINIIKAAISRKNGDLQKDLDELEAFISGMYDGDPDDFKESTVDHPALNSVEEKLSDMREESVERWAKIHGLKLKQSYTNEEKRKLRKWFIALDYDGSGEVNVEELQDPMLSSGILKTREQVVRVLANVDKNQTMGIDFEEFLLALSMNKLADQSKLKRLQEMSADEVFDVNTLISAERREKLFTSILRRCEARQSAVDKIYKKYDKPRLSIKERRQFNVELEKLEELQGRSMYLHIKYISALEGVVQERKVFHEFRQLDMQEQPNNNAKNKHDFYKSISAARMASNSRQEALARLQAIAPIHSSGSPAKGIACQDSLLDASMTSSAVGFLNAGNSLATPSLGSQFIDAVRPQPAGGIHSKELDKFRENPFCVYAPVKKTKWKSTKKAKSTSQLPPLS